MSDDICGAENRHGEPCGMTAGWGTDHVGEGRCRFHGGASPRGSDHPSFVHGLFSDYLDEDDRETMRILEEYEDAEKLEELINWRLARLRRYVREMQADERESFWDGFRRIVEGADKLEADEMQQLAKMTARHQQAVQHEIDVIRKLVRDHNKIAEGTDVNVSWAQALAGDDA